jgi:hypothetical protein
MQHPVWSVVILSIVCGPSLAIAHAQGPQPAAKPAQTTAVTARPAPAKGDVRLTALNGFTVDHPKDWQVLVGVGSSLAVIFNKSKDAAVAIERLSLAVPLAPNEIIDETAEQEKAEWGRRRPTAKGFSHQFQDLAGTRTIIVDYTQPGARGAEHVRTYTAIRGADKLRVVCTTMQPLFDKYKETFHRIAFSLTPTSAQ